LKNNTDDIASTILAASVVADLIGVTPSRLRQLAAAGSIPRADRGRYRLGDVVRGYVNSLKAETVRAASQAASRDRLLAAKAAAIEQRVQRDAGRLVDLNETMDVVGELFAMTRAEIGAVPTTYTRDVPERKRLENLIDAAFNRCADKIEEKLGKCSE
jgi:hypothetical protein